MTVGAYCDKLFFASATAETAQAPENIAKGKATTRLVNIKKYLIGSLSAGFVLEAAHDTARNSKIPNEKHTMPIVDNGPDTFPSARFGNCATITIYTIKRTKDPAVYPNA